MVCYLKIKLYVSKGLRATKILKIMSKKKKMCKKACLCAEMIKKKNLETVKGKYGFNATFCTAPETVEGAVSIFLLKKRLFLE